MAEERFSERVVAPACRWRTSSETLDVIEALERIEALLIRIDQRLQQTEERARQDEVAVPVVGERRTRDATA